MAGRLPPLIHARDAEFFRQRIHKERRGASLEASPRAAYTPRTLSVKPEPLSMMRHPNGGYIYATPVYRQPFANQRPMTSVDLLQPGPYRPTPFILPPRSPELRRELTSTWAEPPLIMSKGFNEPPRCFRKYLEASTVSVHKPSVPVLHWKL